MGTKHRWMTVKLDDSLRPTDVCLRYGRDGAHNIGVYIVDGQVTWVEINGTGYGVAIRDAREALPAENKVHALWVWMQEAYKSFEKYGTYHVGA